MSDSEVMGLIWLAVVVIGFVALGLTYLLRKEARETIRAVLRHMRIEF
ncbi:MAG TPA: hypothetical protein VG055_19310 [Planctomycetaceae bacterium]|jgi:hypothetical protein|nr:hypothetical protein [Planctomycetaceae bacterium]